MPVLLRYMTEARRVRTSSAGSTASMLSASTETVQPYGQVHIRATDSGLDYALTN